MKQMTLKNGQQIVFGRTRPANLPEIKKLKTQVSKYMSNVPVPPETVDYMGLAAKTLADILLNNQLGCCVISGGYHFVAIVTANSATEFHATSGQIVADYSAIGGYVQGHPRTDQGCDEVTAFNYWTTHGFANGTKLVAYLPIDPSNKMLVQQCVWLFENAFFGVELPDDWTGKDMPEGNGFVWDVAGDPDEEQGHAFIAGGYTATGLSIDTWGMEGEVTYPAVAKYCGESAGGALYILLTEDIINKAMAKAPNGFDWPTLVADFNAMGGTVTPPTPVNPPTPVTPPTPVNPPTPVVTINTVTFDLVAKTVTAPAGWTMVGSTNQVTNDVDFHSFLVNTETVLSNSIPSLTEPYKTLATDIVAMLNVVLPTIQHKK